MQEKNEENTVDYGRPDPPVSSSRVFSGVLSVPTIIVGVIATGFGGINLFGLLFLDWGYTSDRPDFVFLTAVILFIGLCSLFLGILWGRRALYGEDRSQ